MPRPAGISSLGVMTMPSPFWESRTALQMIYEGAVKRNTSPWAVLGFCMVKVVAATPPTLVLPPLIGGYASLNLMVAIAGHSGQGKGAAYAVAEEALELHDIGYFPVTTKELDAGTGEGLAAAFVSEAEGEPPIQRAILHESEVTNMAALGGRSGATLNQTLLKAAMGEAIGFGNKTDKTPRLERHSYRLCMTVQVQPRNAKELLKHGASGLPQRFLFLPVRAEDELGEGGTVWGHKVKVPAFPERTVITLPEEVKTHIITQYHERARLNLADNPDDIGGHANLVRLKVAVALAMLDGRFTEVTMEDWELSRVVMAQHDAVLSQFDAIARRDRQAMAEKREQEAEERSEVKEQKLLARARKHIARRLLSDDANYNRYDLRSTARVDIRPAVEGLIVEWVKDGTIVQRDGGTLRPHDVARLESYLE